jgi:hypothetical protein
MRVAAGATRITLRHDGSSGSANETANGIGSMITFLNGSVRGPTRAGKAFRELFLRLDVAGRVGV